MVHPACMSVHGGGCAHVDCAAAYAACSVGVGRLGGLVHAWCDRVGQVGMAAAERMGGCSRRTLDTLRTLDHGLCVCTGAGGDMGPGKYENVGESQSVLYHERSHYLHPHP
eukprot:COSAG01_NODE_10015_length_2274_cov_2.200920_3_plen_111_part_00